MQFSDKSIQEINYAYHVLQKKYSQIIKTMSGIKFELISGWHNGYFHKLDNGQWQKDEFPIPVITVKGICDVHISFNKISVTTKMRRTRVIDYPFEKLTDRPFNAYCVESYLADFYRPGQNLLVLRENARNANSKDVAFSFAFPFDSDGKDIYSFISFLWEEGFYN